MNIYVVSVIIEEFSKYAVYESVIGRKFPGQCAHHQFSHSVAHHQRVFIDGMLRQVMCGKSVVHTRCQISNGIEQRAVQIKNHQFVHIGRKGTNDTIGDRPLLYHFFVLFYFLYILAVKSINY